MVSDTHRPESDMLAQRIDIQADTQTDSLLDGPQSVTFTAEASGFASAFATLTVLDSNAPFYTFTHPGDSITCLLYTSDAADEN